MMNKFIAIPQSIRHLTMEEIQILGYGSQPMTAEEIAQRQEEEASFSAELEETRKKSARRNALEQRWHDAFDLLDDILNRGLVAVKEERDLIKSANPKT